jgi:DNA-directed RNA polymerase subunit RPC12/RpoP
MSGMLFDFPPRKRRFRAHMIDGGAEAIKFGCHRCGYESEWLVNTYTISEAKRGIECPGCNAEKECVDFPVKPGHDGNTLAGGSGA